MEMFLIALLITVYAPWFFPLMVIVLLFVWIYHISVALFWLLIVAILLLCVLAVVHERKK